jgi:hypothetical protein
LKKSHLKYLNNFRLMMTLFAIDSHMLASRSMFLMLRSARFQKWLFQKLLVPRSYLAPELLDMMVLLRIGLNLSCNQMPLPRH